MKVCHVTSAHDSDDFRIFTNECCALAKAGYDTYIVAQGESRIDNGVNIIGVGDKPTSRKERMTRFARKIVDVSLALDCDIYHLHDPELMQFIPKYSRKGKKVIFDSHEDYKYLMLAKAWIPKGLRGVASFLYSIFEWYVCKKLDGYIACYHWTKDRVQKWCSNTQLVFNFPEWKEPCSKENLNPDRAMFCYAGGINPQWLHENAIKAIANVSESRYLIAGNLSGEYGDTLRQMEEWKYVDYIGRIKYQELPEVMYSQSVAGMALLDYIPQCRGHIGNLSNTKLFEYMVNGLPVICTDFDLWKEIIDKYKCGICVNPHNIEEITEAIKWISEHKLEAIEMGLRGNQAIKEEYNWNTNSKGLFDVYKNIQ